MGHSDGTHRRSTRPPRSRRRGGRRRKCRCGRARPRAQRGLPEPPRVAALHRARAAPGGRRRRRCSYGRTVAAGAAHLPRHRHAVPAKRPRRLVRAGERRPRARHAQSGRAPAPVPAHAGRHGAAAHRDHERHAAAGQRAGNAGAGRGAGELGARHGAVLRCNGSAAAEHLGRRRHVPHTPAVRAGGAGHGERRAHLQRARLRQPVGPGGLHPPGKPRRGHRCLPAGRHAGLADPRAAVAHQPLPAHRPAAHRDRRREPGGHPQRAAGDLRVGGVAEPAVARDQRRDR